MFFVNTHLEGEWEGNRGFGFDLWASFMYLLYCYNDVKLKPTEVSHP